MQKDFSRRTTELDTGLSQRIAEATGRDRSGTIGGMRVQIARPAEHAAIAELPLDQRLEEWTMPNVHPVLGLHRHVVKLVEFADVSYVVKELPDDLAAREYRLLRAIADCGLPTAEMVAVVSDRSVGRA